GLFLRPSSVESCRSPRQADRRRHGHGSSNLSRVSLLRMSASAPLDAKRPRWVVVVQVTRPEVYTKLLRTFEGAPWVEVVVDRRRGERRRRADLPEAERRLGERRRTEDDPTRIPEYRLAYHGSGHDVYEATTLAGARCPECELTVRFEMPRFVEP